jgi:hypothetical protein
LEAALLDLAELLEVAEPRGDPHREAKLADPAAELEEAAEEDIRQFARGVAVVDLEER